MRLYRIGNELYFAKNKAHVENWVVAVGGHNIITNHCTREVRKMIMEADAEDYEIVIRGHWSQGGKTDYDDEIDGLHYICPIENKNN